MRSNLESLGILFPGFQLRSAVEPSDEGEYRLVRLGDVTDEGLDLACLPRMGIDGRMDRYMLAAGDVILRSRGGSLKSCVTPDLEWATVPLAPLYVFRLKADGYLSSFISWWINAPEAQRTLEASAAGTSIKTVPISAFMQLEIPRAPLDVQRQIVEADALSRTERRLLGQIAEKRSRVLETQLTQRILQSNRHNPTP